MDETWLPIPGFEGFYEVSDLGRVRSLDRVGRSRWGSDRLFKGRVLKPSLNRRYPLVGLYVGGVCTTVHVHRLVLLAFVGPAPDKHEALHRDDDPRNNRLDNLRWGTRIENAQDCTRNGGWRGGGSALKGRRETHCKRGHPFNEANTYIIPSTGHQQCKACNRARLDAKRTIPHSKDRTHCPQGHPYDAANTAINSQGRRVCRECHRTKQREQNRRKREARLALR